MSFFRQLTHGMKSLLGARPAAAELADEVRHYLAEATLAHERRGVPRAEAERLAALEIGGTTQVHEQVRSAGWEHHVETFVGDLSYALRRLRRSPAFTVTAVSTLALGIGASTAVFSAIQPVLIAPLPFPHASSLVTLDDRNTAGAPMDATLGTYEEVRARAHSLERIAAADNWQPTLSGSGDPERLKGQRVSADYFSVYGVVPTAGRSFAPDDDRPGAPSIVILSDA